MIKLVHLTYPEQLLSLWQCLHRHLVYLLFLHFQQHIPISLHETTFFELGPYLDHSLVRSESLFAFRRNVAGHTYLLLFGLLHSDFILILQITFQFLFSFALHHHKFILLGLFLLLNQLTRILLCPLLRLLGS